MLTVYWYETPIEGEKEVVKSAWEFLNEEHIEHCLIRITQSDL
jgi:hypothetical protein